MRPVRVVLKLNTAISIRITRVHAFTDYLHEGRDALLALLMFKNFFFKLRLFKLAVLVDEAY